MRYFFFKKIDSTNFSNSNNPNCTNDVKFVVMRYNAMKIRRNATTTVVQRRFN